MNDRPMALIVEDDVDSFTVAEITLESAGFRTARAADGREALAMLEAMRPEPRLIVLDLHLPEVDGADVLRQIRADGRLMGVKVIVATAYRELAEEIRDQADHVLLKPFRFPQLQEMAMRLITPN